MAEMQRVSDASDDISIAVADAPAAVLSSSMTAAATRHRRRSSVESLRNSIRRGSCEVAEFIVKRMPTRRMSVRDRRPAPLDLEASTDAQSQKPRRQTSRFAIPRLPSDFLSPVIQVGDKKYNRSRLNEALTKPVKQTKHSLRSVLLLAIVSTLVFGLLSIAWHALHCHMWMQMLHLNRAILLVVPPAIGVFFLIVGLAYSWRAVNHMPDKMLVKAMQELLGVDDEGLETFRQTAATINKAVDSFEQAKASYEKLIAQIAEVQAEFRKVVPSGNLRTAAREMGNRVARQVTDETSTRVEGCMRLVAEKLGIDADAAFAAQGAAPADADAVTDDEESKHANQGDREPAQCPGVLSADTQSGGGDGAHPRLAEAGCDDTSGGSAGSGGAPGGEVRGSGGSLVSDKRCGWDDGSRESPRCTVATHSKHASPPPPLPPALDHRNSERGRLVSPRAESADDDSGTARPAALPEGWHEAQNAEGRVYYYNADGKRQWRRPLPASVASAKEPPVSLASPAVPVTESGTTSAALPAGWRRVQDAQGRPYYYHRETRVRQWHAPSEP